MRLDEFDYELPEELIAQTPLAERTSSRLMTLNKMTGDVRHCRFEQLIDYLQAGDLLVMNDTRVIPARLFGVKKDSGSKVELLLLKQLGGDRWEVLVRPGKRVKRGATIVFGTQTGDNELSESGDGSAPLLTAIVEEEGDMGARIVRFQYEGIFQELLDRLGQMPLPPYIKERLDDKERYQTVYARHEGSAAAPTAGLHFTKSFMERIKDKGVGIAYVTLHVGLGTFRPVSVEVVEEHHMHAEYYVVPEETAAAINETRSRGGRIIAVGTTSARTLETAARVHRERAQTAGSGVENAIEPEMRSCSGWTDIFIYPGYEFQLVGALLTNFHLPKSTLIMLISAMASREYVLSAYEEAVQERYRFFSFGDAMFIY